MTPGEHLPLLRLKVLRDSLVLGPEYFQLPSVAPIPPIMEDDNNDKATKGEEKNSGKSILSRYGEERGQRSFSEVAKNNMQVRGTPARGSKGEKRTSQAQLGARHFSSRRVQCSREKLPSLQRAVINVKPSASALVFCRWYKSSSA